MLKKRRKVYIAIALVLVIYLVCKGYERWPSENWKESWNLVGIWPQLKREGIENIKFCTMKSPQTGYDRDSGFQEILEWFSFCERDVNIVKWWTHYHEVPKECLPECINIIDREMKNAPRHWWPWSKRAPINPRSRMLIVTKKGKYIFHAETDIDTEHWPHVRGENWFFYELGEYLKKCGLLRTKYFVPPKEQTISIVLYPRISRDEFILDFPPLALFGDKKLTEKLFGRTLEPKKIFEGRDWLGKIVDAYETAFKEAEEKQFRNERPCDHYGWIVFVTQDWFYWKEICIGEHDVYGEYMTSEPLKAYFDELGLTKELLGAK